MFLAFTLPIIITRPPPPPPPDILTLIMLQQLTIHEFISSPTPPLLPCIHKVLPTLPPLLHHRHLSALPSTMLCCLRLCPSRLPRLSRSPLAHHRSLTASPGTDAPLYRSFTSSSDTPLSRQKSISVAVLGAPNAGKSTLVNAIVGRHVSAVSPRAQTTRGVMLLLLLLLLLHRAISHRAITVQLSHSSRRPHSRRIHAFGNPNCLLRLSWHSRSAIATASQAAAANYHRAGACSFTSTSCFARN